MQAALHRNRMEAVWDLQEVAEIEVAAKTGSTVIGTQSTPQNQKLCR